MNNIRDVNVIDGYFCDGLESKQSANEGDRWS